MINIASQLAKEFHIREHQVENTLKLIDEGCTIPFIARYRKEATGGLDDAVLRDMHDRLLYIRGLEARREEIVRHIEDQDKLTTELRQEIEKARTMTELEDLYQRYMIL